MLHFEEELLTAALSLSVRVTERDRTMRKCWEVATMSKRGTLKGDTLIQATVLERESDQSGHATLDCDSLLHSCHLVEGLLKLILK